MTRFLILPMPAHGHVNPTLPIAAELTARGHGVTYLLTEQFRAAVEATGATFVTLDAPQGTGPPPGLAGGMPPMSALMDRLTDLAERAQPTLAALHESVAPDVLVLEAMSLWGRLLASAGGARTVGWSPSYVMRPGSPVLRRLGERMGGGPPAVDVERMRALAQRYGADPADLRGMPFGPIAPELVVTMPRVFHPGGDELGHGDGVTFVGPLLGRTEPDDTFELGRMADTPGVFVSLGTVFNDSGDFFRSAFTALADLGTPGVVAHGSRTDLTGIDVPDGVVAAAHVPQLTVLRHTSVFVTHGGMNSAMEAAALGVPMVVVPQMAEQAVTADRVAELGMGVHLAPGDVTSASLTEAIRTVERDPAIREAAQAMAVECRDAGGVRVAADVMELAAKG